MGEKYDFSGYATRNDLQCSDGRVIRRDAFKECDGMRVPLVWNHRHDGPENVIGHGILENREDGVFVYGSLNNTEKGQSAKEAIKHGDIVSLSIYANKLQQKGHDVIHGVIREVSLVLAGANPGAFIENVLVHGEGAEEEPESAIIYSSDEFEEMAHAEDKNDEAKAAPETVNTEEKNEGEKKMPNKEKTVGDVFNELTEEQKTAVYYVIGQAIEEATAKANEGEGEEVKHNVFEGEEMENENVISHAEMEAIFKDAPRYGSLKDSVLAHAEGDPVVTYGIQDVDWLFPEAKSLNNPPDWIKRDTGWVTKVMSGVHHTPFSRIKSQFANLTEDEARAKGYIKGNLKKEQVFGLLKRTTTPTTVYKKQKMDKDDINDITDFNVVSWIKAEMRQMLDEELARAFLIGDGRDNSSDDKINELNIRPIWTDEDLYAVKARFAVAGGNPTEDDVAKAFIKAAIKNRKNYKGSGTPTLFTSEDMLASMLLLEDGFGHSLYKSEAELCTKLRVKEIVTVPQFEGLKRDVSGTDYFLYGIIVNLADYNVGADKGGSVDMFDDFDIDYNQYKYLIETRCSGALTVPFSAMVLESTTELPNTIDSVYPIATLRREEETL